MGIEQTRWDRQALTDCLRDSYGIDHATVSGELHGGISNCYLVQTPSGPMVLKEFPSWYPKDDVLREPDICAFLKARGVPVTRFLATTEGAFHVECMGRISTLQEYVPGTVYAPNQGPKGVVRECASVLGRMHRALSDYPRLPDGMDRGWFYGWDTASTLTHYGDFLRDNLGSFPESVRDRVHDDIRMKMDMLETLPTLDMGYDGLTRLNTHGDFKIQNIVCDHDRVRAVIDVSGCCLPVVWEVIRSYAHADPDCADGDLDIDGLVGYCAAYLAENPGGLSVYDLKCLTDYWLVQLLRANYHGEYLSAAPGPFRDEALRFAGWGTRVCRWLLDNREGVVEALHTLHT